MTSALFTFTVRGKYKSNDGKIREFANLNFLNPMHIISAYWSEVESGARLLNVFTTGASQNPSGEFRPGRTFTFPEKQGQALINHLEDFLRLTMTTSQTQEPQTNYRREQRKDDHRGRRPMEIVEEIITDEDTQTEEVGAVFES